MCEPVWAYVWRKETNTEWQLQIMKNWMMKEAREEKYLIYKELHITIILFHTLTWPPFSRNVPSHVQSLVFLLKRALHKYWLMFKEARKYALNSNLLCFLGRWHIISLFYSFSLPPFSVHSDAFTTADPAKSMPHSKLTSWAFQRVEN